MIIFCNKYFILLVSLIILSACESDVSNILLPEFNKKMVVTGFLSPGDTEMKFIVSSNQRIYGELNTEEIPINIKAYLSDGLKEVALESVGTSFSVSSEIMPVAYGKTYTVRVSDDLSSSCESTCTVPLKRNFQLQADTVSSTKSHMMEPGHYYYEVIKNLKVSFSDFAGEKNYYRLEGEISSYHTLKPSGKIVRDKFPLTFEKELFTDNLVDGKVVILNSDDNLYYYTHGDSSIITLYLLNTEESYYLYHKSIMDHNFDENPFAEATPVYSNINGGLGVFTSYTIDSLIFRMK